MTMVIKRLMSLKLIKAWSRVRWDALFLRRHFLHINWFSTQNMIRWVICDIYHLKIDTNFILLKCWKMHVSSFLSEGVRAENFFYLLLWFLLWSCLSGIDYIEMSVSWWFIACLLCICICIRFVLKISKKQFLYHLEYNLHGTWCPKKS